MEEILAGPDTYHLSNLDIIIVVVSFLAIVPIAIHSARRTKNTDDYFLASRAGAGWVIGLSIIGTSISSLTFLAFPAEAYKGNWAGLMPFLVNPLVAIVAARICLPVYRKTKITSAYEYLEQRFNPFARFYASLMFLLLQIARVGLILVLISLPLKLVTGMSQQNAILLCGIFTTLYVFYGGLDAVLWADVLHTIVLLLGGLFCAVLIFFKVPGGLFEILNTGLQGHKFSVPPFHITDQPITADFIQLTLLVLILHGIFNQLLYYCADQNIIQRYLAARSDKEAKKALWIGNLGTVPIYIFFMFLGTCLYVYYLRIPDANLAGLSPDEIFPHFILTRVPKGIIGVIVAGLLAAAVSSLDSNINAIVMVFQTDIYQRHLIKGRSSKHYLRAAKITTLVLGAVTTLGALALIKVPVATVFRLMLLVYASFAGALAAIILLGMLSSRANARGVTVGIIATLAVNAYLVCSYFGWLIPAPLRSPTHPYLIGAFTNITLLVVSYFVSLILKPPADKEPEQLTVWRN